MDEPSDLSKLPPPTVPDDGTDAAAPREWWEEPGMPWKQRPTRADKACMAWILFLGLFSMAMLPLRGWLLGLDPPLLLALTGSRTGAAASGALLSQGLAPSWWWLALLAGALMSIKLDWVFWWAGKLWGRGMIEVWAGRSRRAQRNYERAERWARKLGWVGIFVAYVPIPLPLMQVIFVLCGASGMSWKRFIALDFVASLLWLVGYFALGHLVGEPAVALLRQYAKIANWVAIALLVVIFGQVFWSRRRN